MRGVRSTLVTKASNKTMREAIAEFSESAAARKAEASDAVKRAGDRASDQASHIAAEARATADRGVDSLSDYVVNNPLAALAIAAGAGFILAHLMRGDRR